MRYEVREVDSIVGGGVVGQVSAAGFSHGATLSAHSPDKPRQLRTAPGLRVIQPISVKLARLDGFSWFARLTGSSTLPTALHKPSCARAAIFLSPFAPAAKLDVRRRASGGPE
jgi:hypothetical protein